MQLALMLAKAQDITIMTYNCRLTVVVLCDFGLGYDCASWSVCGFFFCTWFAAESLYSQCMWLKLDEVPNLGVSSSAHGFPGVHVGVYWPWIASFNDGGSYLNPKSSLLTLIVQKSCKTTYESTRIGNESTQTVIFPGLSRPGSWPVWTRDKMIERKLGIESTQRTGESTQSGLSRIESVGRSTCSDPREPDSK